MSDLVNSTISGRDLYSDTDRIFDGETVPANTSVVSSVFDFGKTLDALELVGEADTEVVIASDMTVTIAWDEDEAGSFTDTQDIAVAAATYAAGDELFRYVADHKKPVYFQVTVATADVGATGTFDVNIASVRKG